MGEGASSWNPGSLELVEIGPGDEIEQSANLIGAMPLHRPHKNGFIANEDCGHSEDIPSTNQFFVFTLQRPTRPAVPDRGSYS